MTNPMTDAAVFVVVRIATGEVVGASCHDYTSAVEDAVRGVRDEDGLDSIDAFSKTFAQRTPLTKLDGFTSRGYRLTKRPLARAVPEVEAIDYTKCFRPSEWNDDDGTVLWWTAHGEPPTVGCPLETDWHDDDSFVFWTRIPNPNTAALANPGGA